VTVGLHVRCHPVDARAVRALNGGVRPLPAHPVLSSVVILTLLAVSGCPGSDDDDLTAGDDDDTTEPWSVVAALSLDGGQSWTAPEPLSDPGLDHAGWAAVAAFDDQVAVVYPAAIGGDQVLLTLQRGSFDGAALTWADPQIPVAVPEIVGALFPTVVFDGAGALHVVARVETDYDAGCDVDTQDCPQERRQVVYLTDAGGSWEARTLSQRWTSTVPELRIDRDGGADGAAVDQPSLWSLDLDDGSEELTSVPGAWLGEGPGAPVKTGLLPPEPVDPGGTPITGGAQLVIGAGDEPVLAATILTGDGGSVVALSRGDGTWVSQPLITSEEHGFNWALPGAGGRRAVRAAVRAPRRPGGGGDAVLRGVLRRRRATAPPPGAGWRRYGSAPSQTSATST